MILLKQVFVVLAVFHKTVCCSQISSFLCFTCLCCYVIFRPCFFFQLILILNALCLSCLYFPRFFRNTGMKWSPWIRLPLKFVICSFFSRNFQDVRDGSSFYVSYSSIHPFILSIHLLFFLFVLCANSIRHCSSNHPGGYLHKKLNAERTPGDRDTVQTNTPGGISRRRWVCRCGCSVIRVARGRMLAWKTQKTGEMEEKEMNAVWRIELGRNMKLNWLQEIGNCGMAGRMNGWMVWWINGWVDG